MYLNELDISLDAMTRYQCKKLHFANPLGRRSGVRQSIRGLNTGEKDSIHCRIIAMEKIKSD